MSELSLDQQVESEKQNVIKRISETAGENLYSAVLSRLSGNTKNTPAQLDYLNAFEQAAAVFKAAAVALRKEMDVLTLEQKLGLLPESETAGSELKQQIADAIFFSNRYALCFAGYVGLSMLGSPKAEIKSLFSFGTKLDASKETDIQLSQLAQIVTRDLSAVAQSREAEGKKPTDDDFKYALECVFSSWVNQLNWPTFRPTAEKQGIDGTVLKFRNYSIKEGSFKRKYDVVKVDDFMLVRKEDVIGSQEFGDVLWSNLIKLACYDAERKENPLDPASVIFTYGPPGGGKTFTAHAYIRSFGELCSEKGIPLWAFRHSTTDYASHYQNLTANKLAELGKEIKEFQGIVVMYVADADNIFHSRKNPDITVEQRQTLDVYFRMFDGTMIPRNGRFMAIMDANYIEGIDDATKSRLFDEIVELKRFETADEFAELARRSLMKGTITLGVNHSTEWREIGDYLLKSPLSNREIGHVIRQLRRQFTIPEEMIGQSYDAIVNFRNEQLKTLTKDRIVGAFDNYIRTRMEAERKSYENLLKDDAQRFLEYVNMNPGGKTASEAK